MAAVEGQGGYTCAFVDRMNAFVQEALEDPKRELEVIELVLAQFREGKRLADFAKDLGVASEHDVGFIASLPEEIETRVRETVIDCLTRTPHVRLSLAYEESDELDLRVTEDPDARTATITLLGPGG